MTWRWTARGLFQYKHLSYQYRNSHYKGRMVSPQLYNGNYHIWKHSLHIEKKNKKKQTKKTGPRFHNESPRKTNKNKVIYSGCRDFNEYKSLGNQMNKCGPECWMRGPIQQIWDYHMKGGRDSAPGDPHHGHILLMLLHAQFNSNLIFMQFLSIRLLQLFNKAVVASAEFWTHPFITTWMR